MSLCVCYVRLKALTVCVCRQDERLMKQLMRERQDQYNYYFVRNIGKQSDQEEMFTYTENELIPK